MSYQNRSPKNLRYGIERLMCNLVCEGKIDIASAQQAFATDWIAAYQKYFGVGNAQSKSLFRAKSHPRRRTRLVRSKVMSTPRESASIISR